MNDFLYLCLKRDVEEGGYKTFRLFGQDILAKKVNRELVVAINRCHHRGFKVAEGCGVGEIKCPYHGLKFTFQNKLSTFEIEEMVFVSQFNKALEPPKMESLRWILEDLGNEIGYYSQEIEAPFHLWIQNTADPNHLKSVHGEGFAKVFEDNLPSNIVIEKDFSSYKMGVKSEVIERYKRYTKYRDFSKDRYIYDGFFHMIVMPHLSITSFLGVFFSIEIATEWDGKTQVLTRFFDSKTAPVPKLLSRMAFESNKIILLEDRDIITRWAKTYNFHTHNTWLPGEERIKAYVEGIKERGLM